MKIILFASLCIMASFFSQKSGAIVIPLAQSQTKYTYVGEQFSNVSCTSSSGNCQSEFTKSNYITGYFVVSPSLPPNTCCQGLVGAITSFNFTDGVTTYDLSLIHI